MTKATGLYAVLLSTVALGGGAAHAQALRLGDFQSTTHIISVEGTLPWMKAVTEATAGKVKFEHFPSQQAGPAAAQLDAVANGVLDLALLGPSYHADILPLNSVVGLPGFYDSAVHGTEALQTMLAEGLLRDEILASGVTPIFGFVLPPYQVLAKKRLGGPGDWGNLNVRTAGSTQAMTAQALGAVGVSIPGPEVYTAVETGRLDAVLFPLPSVPGYNLNEVARFISTNGSFGGYSFVMAMGTDAFNKLTPEAQQAMLTIGSETAVHLAKAQDDSVAEMLAGWKAQGIDTYTFDDAELTEITASLGSVADDWASRLRSDKAAEVLELYRTLTAR